MSLSPKSTKPRRKKVPKALAVIDADNCTGCESCREICPVDCIVKIEQYADTPGLGAWCEVDWDQCIGCKLCIRIPSKKSDAHVLQVCPWEAIEMVPVTGLVAAAGRMTGPEDFVAANRQRLLAAARRQVDHKAAAGGRAPGE